MVSTSVDLNELLRGAKSNDAQFMLQLGICYRDGKFVTSNGRRARYWFKKATLTDDAGAAGLAAMSLGAMYFYGEGTRKNNRLALGWFQHGVHLGSTECQYWVAHFYEKGIGTPPNKAKALSLYDAAANAGLSIAQERLATLLLSQSEGDAEKQAIAASWYRKAARSGLSSSMYHLAICYLRGLGVPQDRKAAMRWLKRIVETA